MTFPLCMITISLSIIGLVLLLLVAALFDRSDQIQYHVPKRNKISDKDIYGDTK